MRLFRRVISRISGKERRVGETSAPVGARSRKIIPDSLEARELYDKVDAVPSWFHSIDLGMGVVTPGVKSPEQHEHELAALRLPALQGKAVLDIGAWDGFYSFAAERLGAARVVALDHFAWALDWEARHRYKVECEEKGIPQEHPNLIPWLWCLGELPGKRGFDLAHAALRSRVEVVVCDPMKMDVQSLGQFDIALYMGVLYHMEDPLEALRRVRQVTKQVAVIETEAVAVGGFEDRPLCEFFATGAKLMDDPTNFWAPNEPALVGLCETAGFSRVELLSTPSDLGIGQTARYRLAAHAFV